MLIFEKKSEKKKANNKEVIEKKKNINKILAPIRSEFGYHIVQLLDIRGTKAKFRHILIQVGVTGKIEQNWNCIKSYSWKKFSTLFCQLSFLHLVIKPTSVTALTSKVAFHTKKFTWMLNLKMVRSASVRRLQKEQRFVFCSENSIQILSDSTFF